MPNSGTKRLSSAFNVIVEVIT